MIIWDADGVLFNTFTPEGQFAWSQHIEADLGINESLIRQIFSGNWEKVLRGQIDIAAHIENVFRHNNFNLPVEKFLSYWLEKDSRINEGVAKYLTLYPSCIGSNQPLLRALKFEEWFNGRIQHVFASSRIGTLKPEPAFYEHIERALELPSEHLCLIDDALENIEAAILRGWRGHLFIGVTELEMFLSNMPNA